MEKDKIELTFLADDFRVITLDVTENELDFLNHLLSIYYGDDGECSGKYIPRILMRNLSEIERKEKAAALEALLKEQADREAAEEEHRRDVRENGPFAMAYKKAMMMKKEKEMVNSG